MTLTSVVVPLTGLSIAPVVDESIVNSLASNGAQPIDLNTSRESLSVARIGVVNLTLFVRFDVAYEPN
jgi:hypothetical protein